MIAGSPCPSCGRARMYRRASDAAKCAPKICRSCTQRRRPPEEPFERRCDYCGASFTAFGHEARYCPEHKKWTKRGNRPRKYGLTQVEITARAKSQGGGCAICGRSDDGFPVVDHCHTTGRPRGLLCRGCNFGLGHLKDDLDLMRAAERYLAR